MNHIVFCSVPVLVTPQPWFWSPVFSATDMMPHHTVLEVPQLQDHKLISHCTLNTVCFYRNISTLTMENKDFSYFSTIIPQYILVSLIPKCLICKLLFESLVAFFRINHCSSIKCIQFTGEWGQGLVTLGKHSAEPHPQPSSVYWTLGGESWSQCNPSLSVWGPFLFFSFKICSRIFSIFRVHRVRLGLWLATLLFSPP